MVSDVRASRVSAGVSSRAPRRRADSTREAKAVREGASKSARRGSSISKVWRTRETSWVASSECPPRSKKLCSTPTWSRRSTSAQMPARISSTGVRGGRAARPPPVRLGLEREERRAVDLAGGRQRQGRQRHEGRRHHERGQANPKKGPELGRAQPARRKGGRERRAPDHERHETPVARDVLAREHEAVVDLGVRAQRGLDLAELDAHSPQLHLVVVPAEVLEDAVGPDPREIAGPVEPRSGAAGEGVGHEALGREVGPARVPARHLCAADAQLAGGSGWDRSQARIDEVDVDAGHGRPSRTGSALPSTPWQVAPIVASVGP